MKSNASQLLDSLFEVHKALVRARECSAQFEPKELPEMFPCDLAKCIRANARMIDDLIRQNE